MNEPAFFFRSIGKFLNTAFMYGYLAVVVPEICGFQMLEWQWWAINVPYWILLMWRDYLYE